MSSPGPSVETRIYHYNHIEFDDWIAAHARWWPVCRDSSVWGRFSALAASGRYTFSQVDQPHRHFAETLIASVFEQKGLVCWTAAKVFRQPGRAIGGFRGWNTRFVDSLLRSSLGFLPQEKYEAEYISSGLRLKNVDVVGFNPRRNYWLFAEAKKDRDRLHPEQGAALSFLQRILPAGSADVLVASVQLEEAG